MASDRFENCQRLVYSDFAAFAHVLGVDPTDGSLSALAARVCYESPLPPHWTEQVDDQGRIYFYNNLADTSSWEHPLDEAFTATLAVAKELDSPDVTIDIASSKCQAHLESVFQWAQDALKGWAGPFEAATPDDGKLEYFCNMEKGESSWLNPCLSYEYNLATRHRILTAVLTEVGYRTASLEHKPAKADDAIVSDSGLLQSLKLPLEVIRLGQAPSNAPDAMSPATSRGPSLPEGTDTARSFISARSQVLSSRDFDF
eukprot:CAMPEP_0204299594 /NCGR_PEP_ID=MMETSP0468-20130131/77009_1 /ASSEMBLY_ACC=CAM_ASM_000383 /TAXON_ID=2969 /ORGANISM="Oxyrrhis marina" /LENGTH=257 /DNA_ID=CAMNT_0051278587 /DNA_START=80 /DNA_END=853 /DNA_ORIENTATION=-